MVKKKGFQKSRMEILTTLLRLRQASCHLELLKLPELKAKRPSGKMELFLELIDEAVDAGHRVLVFSQFVSMLTILKRELADRDLGFCYLDGSTKERGEVVKRFNTDRTIPLFLISLKAGGTGLNLTGADMVIHFDPWWNPAVENQATDRAHRIGQKNTVYSVKLIAEGTVEEKVLELQKKKKAVIDATVESDEAVLKTMSWEDVSELLDL
jgi:SNF2 family DNA or RNA helicase